MFRETQGTKGAIFSCHSLSHALVIGDLMYTIRGYETENEEERARTEDLKPRSLVLMGIQ